ncbi:MAG: hypothetical protein C0514_01755 [Candidatus Puniceispirillum sp.]|nr:hypothetical protein [Candidatus Puniceispirillum sp.]
MLLVCLGAAWHSPAGASQMGEGAMDEGALWQQTQQSLTSVRTFLQGARAAFCTDPTPAALYNCIHGCNALLMTMHTQNILDCAVVDARDLETLVSDVSNAHAAYTEQIPLVELELSLQGHYDLVGCLDGQGGRLTKCCTHVNNARRTPVQFAKQTLAREKLFTQVAGLRTQYNDLHTSQSWALLETLTRHQMPDDGFLNAFWSLSKPLQALLIETKGDREHPRWRVLPEMAAPSAYTNTPWDRICRVEPAPLARVLGDLEERHATIMEAVHQFAGVRRAFLAFEIFDDYRKSYEEVAAFIWAVEKTLVDMAPENTTEEVGTPYHSLSLAWSTAREGTLDGPRELLMKTFNALMTRRQGLTHFYFLKGFHPLLFPSQRFGGGHPQTSVLIGPLTTQPY